MHVLLTGCQWKALPKESSGSGSASTGSPLGRRNLPQLVQPVAQTARTLRLERSSVALNRIVAAVIAFRKVPLKVNIVYR